MLSSLQRDIKRIVEDMGRVIGRGILKRDRKEVFDIKTDLLM